jgi:hypothetical protein
MKPVAACFLFSASRKSAMMPVQHMQQVCMWSGFNNKAHCIYAGKMVDLCRWTTDAYHEEGTQPHVYTVSCLSLVEPVSTEVLEWHTSAFSALTPAQFTHPDCGHSTPCQQDTMAPLLHHLLPACACGFAGVQGPQVARSWGRSHPKAGYLCSSKWAGTGADQ